MLKFSSLDVGKVKSQQKYLARQRVQGEEERKKKTKQERKVDSDTKIKAATSVMPSVFRIMLKLV